MALFKKQSGETLPWGVVKSYGGLTMSSRSTALAGPLSKVMQLPKTSTYILSLFCFSAR
jgi:hypothetical protein